MCIAYSQAMCSCQKHLEVQVGRPALWNGEIEDCCFQNTVIRFRSNTVFPKYALHVFSHFARNGLFSRVSKGVGIHHLSADRFSTSPFLVPPHAEQRRIVAKIEELFSDLDAGVAVLERARANLKRYRAAVLKGAVEGKLTEDWRAQHPEIEPASVLLERILTERRRRWEKDQLARFARAGKEPPKGWHDRYDSPIEPDGDISALPSGWKWATTQQCCAYVTKGTTPAHSELFPSRGDIPFIKIYNLTKDGSLDFSLEPTFISGSTHNSGVMTRSHVFPGDVLMNIVGPPLGKVSIIPDIYAEWNVNQAIAIFRPLPGVEKRYFSYCLLTSHILTWATSKSKATAGQHNLTLEIVRKLPIPVPPLEEQTEIADELDRRLSVVRSLEAQVEANLKRAARLRQGILKRAFEGRLVPQDPTDEPGSRLLKRVREWLESYARGDIGTASKRPRQTRRAPQTRPIHAMDNPDGERREA